MIFEVFLRASENINRSKKIARNIWYFDSRICNMDKNTAHDFYAEHKIILVLCGYIVIKKPLSHFIANIVLTVCQFSAFSFLTVMALYTMVATMDNKVTLVRGFHSFWLLLLTFAFRTIKSLTERSLKEGNRFIKEGVFHYEAEGPNKFHYNILQNRVNQIRFATSLSIKHLIACAFVNVFLFPVMKWMTIREDTSNMPINPYLPVPFYMPFNTRTYYGYAIALFFNACFFFPLFFTVMCVEVTYMSLSLQLIAQMDVLNYSLRNIEKRAITKLSKNEYINNGISVQDLYKYREFQNCLYSCLRENILHHLAILRLKNTIGPYLEALNGCGVTFFSLAMATSLFLVLEEPSFHMSFLICAEIFAYFLVSFMGEIITGKCIETANELYSTPWPHCNESYKLLMKIMATFLTNPMALKSTGFSSVTSLETFADMMTAGYKIVNVVR